MSAAGAGDAAGRRPRRRLGWLWVLGIAAAVVGGSLALARRGATLAPVGRPAPGFSLPDLRGRTVSLASLGPGDVALRFGSVSCTVCANDWPLLGRWQAQAGAGLRIVAVEVGDPVQLVRLRLQGQDLPVPVLIDADGAVARAYGVPSLPAFAFIDRAGTLIAVRAVMARGAVWPDATWAYYLNRLRRADAGG